jgi:poly(3-hydroxybutyrate) depolymerase
MRLIRVTAVFLGCLLSLRAAPADVDAAFARFWSAKDPSAAAKTSADIVKSGASFDDVYQRLKRGRTYATDAPSGTIQTKRPGIAGDFDYVLEIPASYDAAKRYQVRIHLHGGVNRERTAPRRATGIGRLAGAEQIYIVPSAWNEAPWWSDTQLENLRAILDSVKRTYNVDENHVALSGVSDGATGAYYVAMRDPTPYGAILPLNGSIVVLRSGSIGVTGELFPTNLRNRSFFVVNGGRDPLYPTAAVEPYLEHLSKGGVSLLYKPQPNAGHDTSWWPEVKDAFETFVRDHPRTPLPDRLTWETSDTRNGGRLHWLVIESLGSHAGKSAALPDLNAISPPRTLDFGMRMDASKVERVLPGSSAEKLGLHAGDVLVRIDDVPINGGADILRAFQAHDVGSTVRFSVTRNGKPLDLSGTFAPTPIEPESNVLFRHRAKSGRVDLERKGNTVEALTNGVTEFSLLLSPDQFDFSQPVKVTTNGHVAFDGRIEHNVATLVKWAARDNDRTMLFGAEVRIKIQ